MFFPSVTKSGHTKGPIERVNTQGLKSDRVRRIVQTSVGWECSPYDVGMRRPAGLSPLVPVACGKAFGNLLSFLPPCKWLEGGFGGSTEAHNARRSAMDSNKPAQNIQDSFLNTARKERASSTIYLLSGVKLTGRIRSFDKYSVVLEANGQEQLIFKHAISTVVMGRVASTHAVHVAHPEKAVGSAGPVSTAAASASG